MTEETPAETPGKPPMTSGDRSCLGCLGIVGFFVLIFAVIIIAGVAGGDDDSPSGGDALVACHNAVEAQLNNPATADFKTLQTTITDTRIVGVVEADNDFGVTQEIDYTCSIRDGELTGARVS